MYFFCVDTSRFTVIAVYGAKTKMILYLQTQTAKATNAMFETYR